MEHEVEPSPPAPSALEYARVVLPGAFSWPDLMTSTFAAHALVLGAIESRRGATPAEAPRRWGSCLVTALELLLLLAPLIVPGIILIGARYDTFPIWAGIAAALSVGHIITRIREWSRERRSGLASPREVLFLWFAFGFGVLAVAVTGALAALETSTWLWACTALFGVMAVVDVVSIVRISAVRRAALAGNGSASVQHGDVEAEIRGLSDADRAAAAADLVAALDVLAEREIITGSERAAATAAPLGSWPTGDRA